jgi:glutamine---fructose-6-phosphate transaminase (isomerizing)
VFVQEIGQQPEALRDVIRYYQAEGAAALDQLAALCGPEGPGMGEDGPVFLTGMGSSLYAAEGVLSRLAAGAVDARVVEAGEWLHYGLEDLPMGSVVVAISQSGESVETRSLAERLAGEVALVAVTNNAESSMAQAADVVLPIQAGYEEMISTKTYTNTLAVLHLAATILIGLDRGATILDLAWAAEAMEQALDPAMEPLIRQVAGWLDEARALHALARGPALAAARGGALILVEGAHLPVTALPAGSFRHGPMELAGPGHVAIVMAPSGPTQELMERLVGDLLAAGSRVVLITSQAAGQESPHLTVLRLSPAAREPFFALPAAIVIERLLAAVAVRRGLVPGQFRFGGKITEQE